MHQEDNNANYFEADNDDGDDKSLFEKNESVENKTIFSVSPSFAFKLSI